MKKVQKKISERNVEEVSNVLNNIVSKIYELDDRKSTLYINLFLEEVIIITLENYARYYNDIVLLRKLKLADDYLKDEKNYNKLKKYAIEKFHYYEFLNRINDLSCNLETKEEEETIIKIMFSSTRAFLKYFEEQAKNFAYINALDILDEFKERKKDFEDEIFYSFIEEDNEKLAKLRFS